MRLVAGKYNMGIEWTIIEVPKAREVKFCKWIDDVALQWEEYTHQHGLLCICTEVFTAKREIRIIPAKALILIDPIEDEEGPPAELVEGSPEFEAWVKEDVLY